MLFTRICECITTAFYAQARYDRPHDESDVGQSRTREPRIRFVVVVWDIRIRSHRHDAVRFQGRYGCAERALADTDECERMDRDMDAACHRTERFLGRRSSGLDYHGAARRVSRRYAYPRDVFASLEGYRLLWGGAGRHG